MTIRIRRNEAGNCINFEGSSNPTHWNACLSGQVDPNDGNLINVINDIITARTGVIQYEFFNIPFTEFEDRDGNTFTTAQDVADYITANANVLGLSGDGIDLIGETVCFHLDPTSTSIVLNTGHHYGVNTIKAVEENGTISIVSIDAANNIKHFVNLEVGNACIDGGIVAGGISDVVNTLNEFFTVGAFESVVISDPFSTLVANVNGENAGYTLEGATVIDPAGDDLATNSASGNYAGILSVATINKAGEYFTFDIRGEGQIGFGLVHTQESFDDGYYSGNATYAAPSTFAVGNSAHYGFQFSNWFHPTPNGSWTNYGANTSYAQGPGWYSSWDSQSDWLAGNPVKMRVGLDENGRIAIYSLQDDSTWVLHSRSSYPVVEGSEFKLGVKFTNASPRLRTAPKVHKLDTPEAPTALGTDAITVFGEGITGTLAGGISSSATDGLANDGFVSSQVINAVGEYFEFTWSSGGAFNFGLFSENDHDVSDLTSDTSAWPLNAYIFYGSKANSSGNMQNAIREGNEAYTTVAAGSDSVNCDYYGRVGFDGQGRATVWCSADGTNWQVFHHAQAAAPSGDYKFIFVAQSDGVIFDTLQQGVIDTAPTMNFRFIESPDGYYSYPLFATQEEADYYELEEAGVDNGSHTHVYPDDPTNTVWYMPNTSHQMNYELTPIESGITTFKGNPISWTEITSLTNADLVPTAFSGLDQTLSENQAVNLQVAPQDSTWTTTISGLPSGLSFNGYDLITGTTSYVPADESYEITVTRTNSYGNSVGTFNLTIQDSSSIGDLTGYTETAGNFVQPNRIVLSHDALLQYDTVLSEGQQITYSYSQIPPTIGILSADGEANLAAFDPATDTLGTVNGVGGNNFAEALNWDLRFVTFGGYIGSNSAKYALVGWQDNSVQPASEGTNTNVEFKISYEVDTVHGSNYHIVLYRNGVEVLRSNDHYSGDQTITLAAFDDQAQTDVYIPPNWTISNVGSGSTTPPTGFVDPLLQGQMDSLTILDTDSATQLTDVLEIGMRYIFPRAWVEQHILPYVDELNNEVFIGVPASGADWADVGESDFDALFRIKGNGDNTHVSNIKTASTAYNTMSINSMTTAYYDYAIEWDGTDLHVIACNLNDINTQPAVSRGGAFSRVVTESNYSGSGDLNIVIATDNGGQASLSLSGLQKIRIPFGTHDVLVGEGSAGNGQFALQPVASSFDDPYQHASNNLSFGGLTTLNAGETYRFIYDPSLEAGDYIEFRLASDGTTVYNTGVTTFDNTSDGDPKVGEQFKGVTFAVPSDAPPLQLWYYNSFASSFDNGAARPISVSGSTYTVAVTGITQEGPAANQTGSNLFDQGDHAWISLDEQLSAGERLVMDGAFLYDLVTAMPDGSIIYIGLKDTDWADSLSMSGFVGQSSNGNYGGMALVILRNNSQNVNFQIIGADSSSSNVSTTVSATNQFGAFIDITSSGNNVRFGFTYNGDGSSDNEGTTPYADWGTTRKLQTGDRGYGLTSVDVMILGSGHISGNTAGMDSADVDWTGLSEISVPTPSSSRTTSWTKALDFSGSSERAVMVSSNTSNQPIAQPSATTVSTIPAAGYTSGAVAARPWACAVVFKIDGNSSNQHIWNMGEGAGSTDDNIYLRVDAAQNLYFGWGRSGALNECRIATAISSGFWYGVYIAHDGRRFQSAGATPGNLYQFFDIRMMSSHDGFASSWDAGTYNDWNQASSTTGGRMDRAITGEFTIGGRGANRNFHGKVASFVNTTLKINQLMPTVAEAEMMITDPMQWIQDYKVGETYRRPYEYTTSADWQIFNTSSPWYPALATQVWLMGDGTNDSYSNMIRNQVNPADQNYTKLNMISMVSNDIQNITITGLS